MYNSLDPVCNNVHLVQWISHYQHDSASISGLQGECSEFEIEGNPCYEATEMKQSSAVESEAHVYETVREKRAK